MVIIIINAVKTMVIADAIGMTISWDNVRLSSSSILSPSTPLAFRYAGINRPQDGYRNFNIGDEGSSPIASVHRD